MALKREQPLSQEGQNQALKHMVDRFARIGFGRDRTLIETGPDEQGALRRILLEIDETMLPRRIIVRCGPKRQIDLYASNRRLLAVKAEGFDLETVANSPQKLAEQFAEVLRSFIGKSQTIDLLSSQRAASSKDAGVSVSTGLLSQALGLKDSWIDGHSVDATETLKNASIASLHATPSLSFSDEQGPETELGQLKGFWREYIRDAASQFDAWGAYNENRESWAFSLDSRNYLVIVRLNHASKLLAILPRNRLNALTAL